MNIKKQYEKKFMELLKEVLPPNQSFDNNLLLEENEDGSRKVGHISISMEALLAMFEFGAKAGEEAAHFQVPEGYMLVPQNNKYFSHDFNGDGFALHDTLEEAKAAAEADLDIWRDRVADGRHIADCGEYNELAYGVVLGQGAWSVDCVVSEHDHKAGEYTKYEIGTEILSLFLDDAPSTCCIHCNDGDGECVFPYFGLAPHSHSPDQPKPEYPSNYCDTDGGQGVYTHCLVCGADKNTLPFGADHE